MEQSPWPISILATLNPCDFMGVYTLLLFTLLEDLAHQRQAAGVCFEMQENKCGIAMRSEVRNLHQLWGTQLYEPTYNYNFDTLLVPSILVISDLQWGRSKLCVWRVGKVNSKCPHRRWLEAWFSGRAFPASGTSGDCVDSTNCKQGLRIALYFQLWKHTKRQTALVFSFTLIDLRLLPDEKKKKKKPFFHSLK